MLYDHKTLWRDIRTYVRSTGLIIKKLPVTLLKQHHALTQGAEGTWTARYLQAILEDLGFGHSSVGGLCEKLAGYRLKGYCEEVLQGQPWSKHASVYFVFRVRQNDRTVKPLELVGVVCTGTFNPDRYDTSRGEPEDFTLSVDGGAGRAAELEMVLADKGLGRALTLWGIGDTLMRQSHGRRRYDRLLCLTASAKMEAILRSYGFERVGAREVGARTRRSKDKVYSLSNTNTSARGVRERMEHERPGLLTVCGLNRKAPLWQNCR